ncbi:MAG: S8 family serine peptidase [Nitrospirae bacterium]|nr:S8 family serine peptidase [Nitrospirota bacterium]
MKKYFCLLICMFFIIAGIQNPANSSEKTSTVIKPEFTVQSILSELDKGKYVKTEIYVKFKSGTSKESAKKIHQALKSTVIKKSTILGDVERVKLPEGLSVKDAIIQYMANPNVEYASPVFIRKAAGIAKLMPNDEFFVDQWALRNIGKYVYGTKGADIDATYAWRVSTGNYGIIIAVIDTGVDYNHPDLYSNIWRNAPECNGLPGVDDDGNGYIDDCTGWNFVTCESWDDTECLIPTTGNNDPMDDYGHGTHVAGIIGAVGNNALGVTGVMWRTSIMPVRVLNQYGEGDDDDIAEGIKYAVDNGAKVINASLGGYGTSPVLEDAIAYANSHGVLFVAAAGNESNNNDINPVYPASYPYSNIISVAATDQDDHRVAFTNFGYASVDVGAPGVYIISTVPTWMADYYGYGYLDHYAGTSMAAPHVSGLAGLLYSYYYNFNYSQIKSMITTYVDVLPSLDGWVSSRGRINAFSSMSALWEPFDLKAKIKGSYVELKWTDVAHAEQNTIIERKTEGGTYVTLATLGANVNSYTDTYGISEGVKYYYRVRLKNQIGETPGHPDNERSISTGLIAPSGLKATVLSKSKIKLTWFDGSGSEKGFKIYRHDGTGSYTHIKTVGRNVTSYTDKRLAKGTKYWYQVRAYNDSGESEPSNEAEATTSAK